ARLAIAVEYGGAQDLRRGAERRQNGRHQPAVYREQAKRDVLHADMRIPLSPRFMQRDLQGFLRPAGKRKVPARHDACGTVTAGGRRGRGLGLRLLSAVSSRAAPASEATPPAGGQTPTRGEA